MAILRVLNSTLQSVIGSLHSLQLVMGQTGVIELTTHFLRTYHVLATVLVALHNLNLKRSQFFPAITEYSLAL